ncbi:MAG: serine--tRNA ligase, partial [Nitrosopumilus sp.]
MLDPKIIRENPDKIRKMLKARAVNFDFDSLIELDKKRREFIMKTDELRKTRNQISLEFGKKKKSGENTTDLVHQMSNVSQELEKLESSQNQIERDYAKLSSSIPNLIHETVPIGEDETANKEIRMWGMVPKSDFKIQDHVDLSANRDLVDLERAAKVAGARFYFLKNDLVQLNYAIIQYALEFLSQKNYTLVQPPYMINRNSMEGAVIAEDFENVIYKVEDEDLYLIGTSEHAVAAM